MTNREKYEKQILDIACGGFCIGVHIKTMTPSSCDLLDCNECYFSTQDDGDCGIACQEWCNAEYVEPPVDWTKVPVDTPILVSAYDGIISCWEHRYFAKFQDGKVYAWVNGCTSWSANNEYMSWECAKLAEDTNNEN